MAQDVFLGTTFTAPEDRCGYLAGVVLQYVDRCRPLRVLDVGCGTGEQLFALARALPWARLTGVDISEANIGIAEAARRRQACGTRLTFAAGDYVDFTASGFDLILSDSTLQNIDAPTESLFRKIAADMLPGGFLFNSMPYACLYNHALWAARRMCRAIRSSLTDMVLLRIAMRLHQHQFSEALLRQRIHYMYLLPQRYHSRRLSRFLHEAYGLRQIGVHAVPHTSVAQPKHRLTVFRKQA